MSNLLPLLTYRKLRIAVGVLGITLPLVVTLGSIFFSECGAVQESISHTYYTLFGDVLVGGVCAVAFFLILYRGYENSHDSIATTLAGLGALGVAFFPCGLTDPMVPEIEACLFVQPTTAVWVDKAHYWCAALFFLSLTYTAWFLFTKSDRPKAEWSTEKKTRNFVYRTCAILMLICIALIWACRKIDGWEEWVFEWKAVFWLECIALTAFSFSWLIKGGTLWRDIQPQE